MYFPKEENQDTFYLRWFVNKNVKIYSTILYFDSNLRNLLLQSFLKIKRKTMVYLGVNSNNGSSSSTSGSAGHNKNGSRTPELVDLDTEKPNERNGGKIIW